MDVDKNFESESDKIICSSCTFKGDKQKDVIVHFLNEHLNDLVHYDNSLYSCLLCEDFKNDYRNSFRHVMSVHKEVNESGLTYRLCKRFCGNSKKSHYHCHCCKKPFDRMKTLLKHLENKDQQSDSQLENPIEIHFDVESQLNSKPKNQVNCDLCGIAIQKKNLATHKKRVHSDKPKFAYHEGVVVDMSRGVYLHPRTPQG